MKTFLLPSVLVVFAAIALKQADATYYKPKHPVYKPHCYVKYIYVTCGYGYYYDKASCYVPGTIVSVKLYHELSHYKCSYGNYYYSGYYLYTKYGCYAKFYVGYKICIVKPPVHKPVFKYPVKIYHRPVYNYKRPVKIFRKPIKFYRG